MAVETLAGKEIAYYIANLNEGVRDVSPSLRIFITQSLLEPLLKSRATELGAELRFSTEMISFAEDRDGVTAKIRHRDTGEISTVRAQIYGRGGRQPQQDPRSTGHPHVGPRRVLEEHHDLFPR